VTSSRQFESQRKPGGQAVNRLWSRSPSPRGSAFSPSGYRDIADDEGKRDMHLSTTIRQGSGKFHRILRFK
jgi:hypothetical protein